MSVPQGTSYSGGDAAAATGALDSLFKFGAGDTGNIDNGGITINKAFKFDGDNPLHIGGAVVVVGVALAYLAKLFRKK